MLPIRNVNVRANFNLFVVCRPHVIGKGSTSSIRSVIMFGNEAHMYSFSLSIHFAACTSVEAQAAEKGLHAAKLATLVAMAVQMMMAAVIQRMMRTLR